MRFLDIPNSELMVVIVVCVFQLYKQRLQRTKEGSKQSSSSNQRQSPVHGNHAALGSSSNGSSSGSSSTTQASGGASQSKAIMIPVSSIPKSGVPRHKGSVEGIKSGTYIYSQTLKTSSLVVFVSKVLSLKYLKMK